jgi:hypothetical protein
MNSDDMKRRTQRLDEANQILAITVSSIRTARSNNR